jgi:hypothetical protein
MIFIIASCKKNRLKQGEYTLSKQTDTLNTTGITALPALGKGRVALDKDLPSNNLTVNAGFAECRNSYTRQRIDAVEEVTVWFFISLPRATLDKEFC